MELCLPDYKGGSIVNLMSSIASAFHGKNSYPHLRALSPEELKKYESVILIVIDGLGYEYLLKKQNSFLRQNIRCKITSVFLPTTAAAITTFLTGEAPQQHGITSWFMSLKETGGIVKILPFVPRIGGEKLSEKGVDISKIIMSKPFFEKIDAKSYSINPKELLSTPYTNATRGKSEKIGFGGSFKNMTSKISRIANKKGRKYIYAYWPMIDCYLHEFGVGSKKEQSHFKEIDKALKNLLGNIKDKKTVVIVTADHGHINTPAERNINLQEYPEIYECLSQPLAGEGRTPFCYVHPSKARQFEEQVKAKLSKFCELHKSEEIIARKFFGLGTPNPKLFDRAGDYMLITKENYRIKDYLTEKEKKSQDIGHHGGLSREEMLVPLIILKP